MRASGRRPGFFRRLREDFKNFDLHNEEEGPVLRASFFSAYKRTFVLRTGLSRSGSFGIIFLKRALAPEEAADEVRHEYGHVLQLKRLGLFSYFRRIALPSFKSDGSAPDYYDANLWEVSADVLGGAEGPRHRHSEARIEEAFAYLRPYEREL